DGEIKIWDLENGAEQATLRGHSGIVSALAFAPDGTLASAGEDAAVRLWSPTREAAPIILRGHQAAVLALAFSAAGRTLVSRDPDGVVMVWDPARGVARQALPRERAGVSALAFDPQGEYLLSGNRYGAVARWQGEPPPPPPPTELLPERFYQDFRGAKPPRLPLRVEGDRAEDVTRPEDGGLRVTLPSDWKGPGVWVRPHVLIQGDFDVTARYELLAAGHPVKGGGAGVVLAAVSSGSRKMAKLCRLVRPLERDCYLADITDHAAKKVSARTVPSQ